MYIIHMSGTKNQQDLTAYVLAIFVWFAFWAVFARFFFFCLLVIALTNTHFFVLIDTHRANCEKCIVWWQSIYWAFFRFEKTERDWRNKEYLGFKFILGVCSTLIICSVLWPSASWTYSKSFPAGGKSLVI